MNVLSGYIERRSNESQHRRKDKCGADCERCRHSYEQDERGRSEAASTNCRKADGKRDHEADQDFQMHHSARLENVWMPHSSLAPPQRPERGSAPSCGTAVQGWQPMLR